MRPKTLAEKQALVKVAKEMKWDGLTLREIAKFIGVHPSTVWRWLKGTKKNFEGPIMYRGRPIRTDFNTKDED